MRRIYRILPDEDGWKVEVTYPTKTQAEQAAMLWANESWANGHPAQVVVHTGEGKIELEWTYGEDPERSVG